MKDTLPLMSFGVMGGPMQAQGHIQLILRTELWGQDPKQRLTRLAGGLITVSN